MPALVLPSSMTLNLSQTRLTLIDIASNAKTKSAPGTSMLLHSPTQMCGEFTRQFKLILVMASTTLDTPHCNVDEEFISTEFLPNLRSNPKIGAQAIKNHLKEEYGVE